MKILITGAAGFLGRHLVAGLAAEHDLTLTDLPSAPGFGIGDLPWHECDVADFQAVRDLIEGHDAVIHTVALVRGRVGLPIERFVDVVVKGTWNVAEASARAGVRRLINISSVTAGGWPPGMDHPSHAAERHPFSDKDLHYSLSKWLGECIVNAYGEAYPSLAILNIRPGILAGDGVNPGPSRVDAPFWFSYVDVHDVVGAIRESLKKPDAPRGTYAIVAGRPDALFDWESAASDLGYVSGNTWPTL
jgi:nucleoside-diphosphate-sugar epimerase